MTARYSEECPLFTSRKPCHLSKKGIMVCSECIKPKEKLLSIEEFQRSKLRILVRLAMKIHR